MWLFGLSSDDVLPLPNSLIPRLGLSFPEFDPSRDFFPVMRSSDDRVRSSEDLLDPDNVGPLAERVTV